MAGTSRGSLRMCVPPLKRFLSSAPDLPIEQSVRDETPDYLTDDQRRALETELAELEGPRRAEAVESIKTARSFGDLSENFEYHAARQEQAMLERRIALLRARLDNSVVIRADDRSSRDTVSVGSVVQIEDDAGERLEIEISSAGGDGAVSPDSPLGSVLLGARKGESVEVRAPRGAWQARILQVK